MTTKKILDEVIEEQYAIYHDDCVEGLMGLRKNSMDYSIFSPPFASLYTYSNSPRDLGNVKTYEGFFDHFSYVIDGLLHSMKPGRNVSFHTMELPTSKERDGYIGLRDFPGDLIRAFEKRGFIYHSKVTIWKNPVIAMQRTKALGLLHKTVRENSTMSRQGIADYLITMRAPGENPREDRVTHREEDYPVDYWQKIASPIWMDIDPSDTLQHTSAREHDDERHVCPLQLTVIRRGIELWSNPGDTVLSPFGGIGSEGVVSVELKRKFVGFELKESYFKQQVKNLYNATRSKQGGLFG